jgi:hypothetical protein
MNNFNSYVNAIVLVNPLGKKCDFRDYAVSEGLTVVSVYSISEKVLSNRMGQDVNILKSNDDIYIFSDDIKMISSELKNKNLNYVALIPCHECGVEFAALLAKKMDLIHNSPEAMIAARDKRIMRQKVAAAGLNSPSFCKVASIREIDQFIEQSGFPVVIKTPLGGGTSNVFVCDCRDEVINGFNRIRTVQDLFGNLSDAPVLETFLDGKELIVDGFVCGNDIRIVGVWEYDKIDNKFGKNLYYNIWGRDINSSEFKEAIEYTEKVVAAIGIQFGMFHCELKYQNGSPALVEIGSRLPGWGIPELYRAATHFDPWKSTIEVFTNGALAFPVNPTQKKHYAMTLCPIEVSGLVTEVLGVDKITTLPSYEQHILKVKTGNWVSPTSELYDIPIEVCLAHENEEQLIKDIALVHDIFKVVVAPSIEQAISSDVVSLESSALL